MNKGATTKCAKRAKKQLPLMHLTPDHADIRETEEIKDTDELIKNFSVG